MIKDMDMIITDEQEIILVVPTKIGISPLTLELYKKTLKLCAQEIAFVHVEEIDEDIIEKISAQAQIGLIEVCPLEDMPDNITHNAKIIDKR